MAYRNRRFRVLRPNRGPLFDRAWVNSNNPILVWTYLSLACRQLSIKLLGWSCWMSLKILKDKIIKAFLALIPNSLKIKTFSIILWLSIGILIRLFVMPLFAHADFTTTMWVSFTVFDKHELISG